MKKCTAFIFVMLLASMVFARGEEASLNATGYAWLGYSKQEKAAFVELVYVVYSIDKKKNKPADLVKTLDDFYYGAIERAKADPLHVDEDDFLKVRCIDVIKDKIKRN